MTIASQVGSNSPLALLAAVIVGVSVATATLGWMMWRGWKSAERAETDSRHRRRSFIRLGLIYVAAVAIGGGVLTGREPKESLIGLPIACYWLGSG